MMLRTNIQILCICAALSITPVADAQTAVWAMKPMVCSDCTYLGKGLFKIMKDGKVGLVNSSGDVLAACEYDNLTPFYEDKALLTLSTSKGERVVGCVTENGTYHAFTNTYYTLQGQNFYSDGLLSVSNAQGRVGYIDIAGNEVVGFDGMYDRIKPFCEGYAAVFKNKKYSLINKSGEAVRFYFNDVGELYGGTNVYNNEVYVWDTDGVFYVYNTQKGGACKRVKLSFSDRSFDYLYRLNALTHKGRTRITKSVLDAGHKGLEPVQRNGQYGYVTSSCVVLPPQFQSATAFVDGYAVVKTSGEMGILRYVDNQRITPVVPSTPIKFYAPLATCDITLSVPDAWTNKKVNLRVTDDEGTVVKFEAKEHGFTFKYAPEKAKHLFNAIIESEGLVLFNDKVAYQFDRHQLCSICHKDLQECGGKHPVITNNVNTSGASKGHVGRSVKPTPPPAKEKKCPTCGQPISKCKFQGVH